MTVNNMVLNFKFNRDSSKIKKTSANLTLLTDRFDNLHNAISNKSEHFKVLNKSEQVDFMLYLLELCLETSTQIDLKPIPLRGIINE